MAVLRMALFILAGVLTVACRTGAEQWGPFRGQVIDAETGQPIAGAHVMVLWVREPPSLHFAERFYDAQETTTNADGRFEIPHQARVLTAFVREPDLSVFAPRYQMQAPQVGRPEGRRFVDATIVPMRPLKTREEQCKYHWRGPLVDVDTAVPNIMQAMQQHELDLNCRSFEGQ